MEIDIAYTANQALNDSFTARKDQENQSLGLIIQYIKLYAKRGKIEGMVIIHEEKDVKSLEALGYKVTRNNTLIKLYTISW